MAEIELNVLAWQCLHRRIDNREFPYKAIKTISDT